MKILDAPASTISGRTFVPLRFVGESFGSDVKWVGAIRTIYITDQNATTPLQSPPDGANMMSGRVIRISADRNPQSIEVQNQNRALIYDVARETQIFQTELGGTFSGRVGLSQIYPGDDVTIYTLPSSYKASRIESRYKIVRGIVSYRKSNNVYLKNGLTVQVNPDAKIILEGRRVSIDDISSDMEAEFRVNPALNESWSVSLRDSETKYPPPRDPEANIESFTHNALSILVPGNTITFILKGTSGGTATFSIPGVVSRKPMPERYSGFYEESYTIKTNDPSVKVYPYATLEVVGRNPKKVETGSPITIQTKGVYYPPIGTISAPEITSPQFGTRVGSSFTVQGKALPNAIVYIKVEENLSPNRTGTALESQEKKVRADSYGIFSTTFKFILKPSGINYIIRAYQADGTGKTSPTATVQVKQR
jgi:hypothetical protein